MLWGLDGTCSNISVVPMEGHWPTASPDKLILSISFKLLEFKTSLKKIKGIIHYISTLYVWRIMKSGLSCAI